MERRISVQATLCAVGCLHLITFTSLLLQSPLLFGQHGLQPITGFLHEAAHQELGAASSYAWNPWAMLQFHPTLLVFHGVLGLSAEAAFAALCVAGAAVGFAAACGAVHPVIFTALWLLYLSVVSVGQAFLPQPGDTVLLEVTFACVWLSLSMLTVNQQQPAQQQEEVDQDAEHLEKQRQEAAAQELQAAQQPAALLLRWLLFKLLLLTSSAKALSACVPARGLAECYSVLTSHSQPHSLTWLLQALPAPLAASSAALVMLELPASFAVLLPAPVMQAPVALLLVLQLARAATGSQVLLHLAAAALCLAVLDDSWLVPVLQRVARCFTRGQAADGDTDGARPGGLQRADSNVSLASIMSLEELQPSPEPAAPRQWDSPTMRTLGGLVALTAALALGNSAGAGRVLWLTSQQLTSTLGVLVPAAAGWWLFTWVKASWQSYTRASAASAAASAALQQKLQAAAEAAARADAAAGMPAAGSAARAKPTANGLASPDPLLSPAASPTPIKAKQLAAATPAGDATGAKHGASNGPAAEGGAAASATDTEEEGSTPRAGRRRAAAKSTPQLRKGRMAKAAAPAGDAATEGEEEAETQEHDAAPAAAPARGAKRATGGRGRKAAAAAPAGEATEDEGEPAAAAAPTPGAVAVVAATPATAAKAAATTPVAAGKAPAARAASRVSLQERLAPQLVVVAAVSVASVALLVFLAGLPAVLAPAGWSQATLKSAVPALMAGYRTCRTLGIVASSSSLQRAWASTSAAAASGSAGSYLAFELSTSDDGWSWQPVQFRQSGFAVSGSSMEGTAGSVKQEGVMGRVRGVYEPRLQGRLAAAGSGSLEDNSWLLGLADKVLEGSPDLGPHLVQPVQPHSWVRIDLMRYTPTSLPAMRGACVPGGWVAQHVAEVLPVMPRGDPDWKETLLQLGMGASAAAPRSIIADIAAHVAYPGWLLSALVAAVAVRHCLFAGGLVYSLRAEGLNKAAL